MTGSLMMTRPIVGAVDPYFDWLCNKVGIGHSGNLKPYRRMASQLHGIIFKPTAIIDTDLNRANDGLQLRVMFMERYGPKGSSENRGPCTMLEFLIGLARRMSFLMGEETQPSRTKYYFWCMINNLWLLKYDDDAYEELNGEFFVEEAVNRVLNRTYANNGDGGLFPLRHSEKDQRTVEIWYQMHAWLNEHCIIEID